MLLSQLRKWCYFYNRTDAGNGPATSDRLRRQGNSDRTIRITTRYPFRSRGSLELVSGASAEDWSLSPLLLRFCEQNGAMPDPMNRGEGWATEDECSSVLKVLGLRFGANVCMGACVPWEQPCPSPPPPPPKPPLPVGPGWTMWNGAKGSSPYGSNSTGMPKAPAVLMPPQNETRNATGSIRGNVSSRSQASPPPTPAPCPSEELNGQRPIEQQSEQWQAVSEPTGLQGFAQAVQQQQAQARARLMSKH